MNKKAIQLSINFLVIIIISLVILGSGLIITQKFFSTATDIKTQLDSQTIAQIEDLLDEGDIIAMPINSKTLEQGNVAIYGLGVININPGTTSFSVDVNFKQLVTKNKEVLTEINGYDPNDWLLYENIFNLGFKESRKVPIRAEVAKNALPGTYIYNVNVNAGTSKYGITKMYIVVP